MTDREKLIELIDHKVDDDWYTSEEIADYLLSNGVRLESKQATSDENKRWIPVSERLPEKMENVLAWCDNEFLEVCFHTGFRWETAWDHAAIYFVTHWMPLPEPPKEGLR